jgi:hypothetical protein
VIQQPPACRATCGAGAALGLRRALAPDLAVGDHRRPDLATGAGSARQGSVEAHIGQ